MSDSGSTSGSSITSQASSTATGEVSALTEPSAFKSKEVASKKKTASTRKKKTVITVYVAPRDPVPMADELIPIRATDVVSVVKKMMKDQEFMEIIIPEHVMTSFKSQDRPSDTIFADALARVEDYRDSIISLCAIEYDKEVASRASVEKLGSNVVRAVSPQDVWDVIKEEKFKDVFGIIERIGQVYWIPFKKNPEVWLKKARTAWEKKYMVKLLNPSNPRHDSSFSKVGLKAIRDRIRGKVNQFLVANWSTRLHLVQKKGCVPITIPNLGVDKGLQIILHAEIAEKRNFEIQMGDLCQEHGGKSEGSECSGSQDAKSRMLRYEKLLNDGDLTKQEYHVLMKVCTYVLLFDFPLNL